MTDTNNNYRANTCNAYSAITQLAFRRRGSSTEYQTLSYEHSSKRKANFLEDLFLLYVYILYLITRFHITENSSTVNFINISLGTKEILRSA